MNEENFKKYYTEAKELRKRPPIKKMNIIFYPSLVARTIFKSFSFCLWILVAIIIINSMSTDIFISINDMKILLIIAFSSNFIVDFSFDYFKYRRLKL